MAKKTKVVSMVAFVIGALTILPGCETIKMAGVLVKDQAKAGAGGLGIGAAAYFACRSLGKDTRTCNILAGTVGLVTYAYLKKQAQKMEQIEGVMVAECDAKAKGKQAYCVNVNEQAMKFEKNSYELSPVAKDKLHRIAQVLKESPATYIYVEGHTDPEGKEDYNQWLSDQRAYRVKSFFLGQGIQSDRIEAIGWGESRPLQKVSHQQLRRVELRVEGGPQDG